MVQHCTKYQMKPVCDHPNYCRNDGAALYLGQSQHISYPYHRRNNNWIPSGFSKISSKWNNLCVYSRFYLSLSISFLWHYGCAILADKHAPRSGKCKWKLCPVQHPVQWPQLAEAAA